MRNFKEKQMANIAQDQYVELEYRVRLDDGELLRGTAQEPALLTFVAGCGELLQGLERRLWGVQENESLEFIIPAADAFGAYDHDFIQVWSRKSFPPDMDLSPGQKFLPANMPIPPEYPLTIKEVDGDRVILDMNHPLAGHDLHYQVRVILVRPATPEELAPLKECQSCREEIEGKG
jgi:FKBP-type peptidyl-prolyl cis-trans isomerase SlyD